MNISEFAKIAGVSKSAVSRYFNDGYLSQDKREKIEAAIEKTGYSPSLSARSIRTRVTKLVGVILPKLSSESCARVTEGISSVLSEYGYELLLVTTSNDNHKEIESLELFRQNRVDGVILLSTIFTDLHKSVLAKMRVPVILVGQQLKGFNCVCHDDYGAARSLTRIMLEKGAVKPAYIGVDPEDKAAGEARRKGFELAVADAGIKLRQEFTEIAEFTIDSGYEKARRLLSGKEKPDCIFCATDSIAAGAMLLFRCCSPEQAMKSINWDILMVFAGSVVLGLAVQKTGIAERLAFGILDVCGDNPYVVMTAVCLVATFATEFISNTAAGAMFFPIMYETAEKLGYEPYPFLIALMISVSSSFATPIGSPTHMLVYGPGGYQFKDFIKIGFWMNLIILAANIVITNIVYPLTPINN